MGMSAGSAAGRAFGVGQAERKSRARKGLRMPPLNMRLILWVFAGRARFFRHPFA
jgi:hypothetical protein